VWFFFAENFWSSLFFLDFWFFFLLYPQTPYLGFHASHLLAAVTVQATLKKVCLEYLGEEGLSGQFHPEAQPPFVKAGFSLGMEWLCAWIPWPARMCCDCLSRVEHLAHNHTRQAVPWCYFAFHAVAACANLFTPPFFSRVCKAKGWIPQSCKLFAVAP